MTDSLNPSQRTSIRTTLRAFEKSLRDAGSWLNGVEEDGILYAAKVRLPVESRQEVAREIAAVLERIGNLSASLDLEKTDDNPLRRVRSELVISWANLLDTRSTKLRRYGTVPAQIAEQLDPAIRDLADAALHLSQVFDELANEQE